MKLWKMCILAAHTVCTLYIYSTEMEYDTSQVFTSFFHFSFAITYFCCFSGGWWGIKGVIGILVIYYP